MEAILGADDKEVPPLIIVGGAVARRIMES
jgi:hypothetical protein